MTREKLKDNKNKLNDFKSIEISETRESLVLTIGILIFVSGFLLNMKLAEVITGWQGVVAQIQVMASVYLVVYTNKKGYITATCLNLFQSLMVIMYMVRSNGVFVLPGMVIPLCTIVIISIIRWYGYRLNRKVEEVIEERTKRAIESSNLQEISIMSMAMLAEARDNDTGRHIQRTKLYVKVLAEYLLKEKIFGDELDSFKVASFIASAPLHDIGKVGTPDSILLKPAKLTKDEFEIMKLHTEIGYEAIVKVEELTGHKETFLKDAADIVLYHHERWDGSGYLYQLKGYEIPLSARIMSVADVYDALTGQRIYKKIQSHEEAVNIICEESGQQFDPKIVAAFKVCQNQFKEIAEQYKDKLYLKKESV